MTRRKNTIQRVELNKYYYVSIYCPFCGQCILAAETENTKNGDVRINPCPHTLFVAHDIAFEYRSDRFNVNLGIENIESDDYWDEGIDFLTDKVTLVDSIKFATYVGIPSGFGTYLGFAPLDDD
jgi:hypothetical protein